MINSELVNDYLNSHNQFIVIKCLQIGTILKGRSRIFVREGVTIFV